jgi:hypothetical protein
VTPIRTIVAALATAVPCALVLGVTASATGETTTTSTATGTFAIPTDYTPIIRAHLDHDFADVIYKGDVNGTAIDYGTFDPTTFSGSGTEYCVVCTIGGKKGGYTATYRFAGNAPGVLSFTRGFGGLTGLEGGGTFTSKGAYNYHYTLP